MMRQICQRCLEALIRLWMSSVLRNCLGLVFDVKGGKSVNILKLPNDYEQVRLMPKLTELPDAHFSQQLDRA